MSRSRVRLLAALSAALGTVMGLTLVEAGLRAAGERPWHGRLNERSPAILTPDPVLGWRPRPGLWWFGPYGKEERRVSARIWPDGSRATAPTQTTGRPEVLLVGCSLTMGWAVNDDESWAWRLQQLRPDMRVTNRGVVGFGTYHALLLLEERLRAGDRPSSVVYGYFYGHDERNVASAQILLGIAMYSLGGMARTPYCSKGADGTLVRHPPEAWPMLPLHDHLALVDLIERGWVSARARQRTRDSFEITNLLVAEMAELCRRHGIPFAMVVLLAPAPQLRAAQLEFMRARGISVIDCDAASAAELQDGLHMVPDEGHPDAAVHAWWATCIAAGMKRASVGIGGGIAALAH